MITKRTYGKLRELIGKKFGSVSKFANEIELDAGTLSLKLNSKREWRCSEIEKICNALEIPANEIHEYFFY